MKKVWWIVLLSCAMPLHAVAQSRQQAPSEEAAKRILASRVDQGRTQRLLLDNFKKVDGRTTTGVDGVTRYTMFINAEVAVHDNVSIISGITLGTSHPISEIRLTAPAGSDALSRINAASNTVAAVCQGQRLKLTGNMVWELFESGWRHSGVEVKLAIDGNGIDCGPMATTAAGSANQTATKNSAESALARDLKAAVRSQAKCNDIGELHDLKRIEVGQYAANGRPYYTYAFNVEMLCKPSAPLYAFRGRVDHTGRVRFVVQVDPAP